MKNIPIEVVEELLQALKAQDQQTASLLLGELTQLNQSDVVHQVEEIALNLHNTLDSFGEDAELLMVTKHDLPDVSERLSYVMQTTEEASNKTLSSAENALAIIENLLEQFSENAEVRQLLSQLQSEMTDIMMSQSFQDLTGQVLKRVMILVSSLEQSLVDLIEKSGIDYAQIPGRQQSSDQIKAAEMQGIGPNVTQKSKQDSASSQDEVDDLLGDLGI